MATNNKEPWRGKMQNDPRYWFVQLCEAADSGNFEEAARCQQRLRELGWEVKRSVPEVAAC